MKKLKLLCSLSAFCVASIVGSDASAQFVGDPAVNTVIRDSTVLNGEGSKIVTAPNGKSFVLWAQKNSVAPGNYQMRMQLIDSNGIKQWDPAGIIVDSMLGSATYVDQLILDKQGNAIYLTTDKRPGLNQDRAAIYKIDQQGNFVWGADGIRLIDTTYGAATSYANGVCVTDSNNIVVSYQNTGSKVYVTLEKFSPSGVMMWASPKRIVDVPGATMIVRSRLAATGGESFVAVVVKQNGGQLLAQKYDGAGNTQWPSIVRVSNYGVGNGAYPSLMSDGYGGVLATFQSNTPSSLVRQTVYAQRIYPNGSLWDTSGKQLVRLNTGGANQQNNVATVFAPAANSYFTCMTIVNGTNSSSHGVGIQKIDTAGNLLFDTLTSLIVVPLSTGTVNQDLAEPVGMKVMDSGIVIVHTTGPGTSLPFMVKIAATKLSYSGVNLWPSAPVAISTVNSYKQRIGVGDFTHNQIVLAWIDTRTVGMDNNPSRRGGVYTQNLRMDSVRGIVCPVVTLASMDTVRVNQDPITLTGGLPSGGRYFGPGVVNGVFSPAATNIGIFKISYVYQSGPCIDTVSTNIVVVKTDIGIANIAHEELFDCYPNPTNGQFTVVLKDDVAGKVAVKITAIDGSVILNDSQNSNGKYSKTFDISRFAKGFYMAEVSTPKGVAVVKLVLQ